MNGLGICLLQMLQPHKFSTDRLALVFYITTHPFCLLRLAFLVFLQFCSLVLPQVTISSATSSFMATLSTGDAPPRMDTANLAIVMERDPPKWRLLELGIRSWPKRLIVSLLYRWGCSPGRYLTRFDAQETCYLLKGKVKAYSEGSSQCVEFGAGDLVVIPKGVSSTWDVIAL
ncbi:unnamed protein product [Musa hybrid cultivar]